MQFEFYIFKLRNLEIYFELNSWNNFSILN